MDDLRPIEDRDDLEGAAQRVSSGRDLGLGLGQGPGSGVADTHRQVCLQLILNLPPVVYVVVHLVIVCHIDIQQDPLVCGFEPLISCGERDQSWDGVAQKTRG